MEEYKIELFYSSGDCKVKNTKTGEEVILDIFFDSSFEYKEYSPNKIYSDLEYKELFKKLIGKTITVESKSPCVYIASGIKVID